MIGRRRVLGRVLGQALGRVLVGAAGAGVALARPALGQAVPTLQTMRSSARSWIWIAEDYAREAGFFAQAGVKVVSNASGRGNNVPALAGSGVDIVLGDQSASLPGIAQGFRVRTFVQLTNRYATHVVVKRTVLERLGISEASPPAAKYAALKGLVMGTTGPGSATDSLLRWLGVQGGLDPGRDMRLVPVQGGGPGMVAGVQQGALDGFSLSSPTSDIAVLRAGCGYLFEMCRNPPAAMDPFCYIVGSASLKSIAENREALVRYAMGIGLAQRSIARESDRFKAWSAGFLELDASIAEAAFASNGAIQFAEPTPTAALYPRTKAFVNTVLASQKEAPLPEGLGFAQVYETGIAAEAMTRIG